MHSGLMHRPAFLSMSGQIPGVPGVQSYIFRNVYTPCSVQKYTMPSLKGDRIRLVSPLLGLLTLLPVAAFCQTPDPQEIIRRSLRFDEDNWKRSRDYTFLERFVERKLDSDWKVKSTQVITYDITLLDGAPYRRVVSRDDKPLPAEEERKEQAKLQKSIAEQQKLSTEERRKRAEDAWKVREERRSFLNEVVDAFSFRILREESFHGRDVWVIEATPRPGYEPRRREAKFLPKIQGRLWIDKNQYHWLRLEAESIDTMAFAWFVARVQKGARLEAEQTLVNNDVWLIDWAHLKVDARLGFFARYRADVETTFKDFRKFQTDSRFIDVAEAK